MMTERIGGTTFKRLAGCSNEHVRLMEALRVISPSKSDTGIRQFAQSDVTAARKWMKENSRSRKQRACA